MKRTTCNKLNLQTSCNKSVHKLLTSCVRIACSKLLEHVTCQQLVTSLMGLSDLLQGCSDNADTFMI